MADFVPFVVMSVEDPRLAEFRVQMRLDLPEHCWVLCEVDPAGKVARVVSWDGGEPEDQSLVRDWSWVQDVLNQERGARDIECDALRTTLARLTAEVATLRTRADAADGLIVEALPWVGSRPGLSAQCLAQRMRAYLDTHFHAHETDLSNEGESDV